MIATLTLSRAREIRISFLLFPWAIPFALDWFRAKQNYLSALIGRLSYWIFSLSVLGLLSALILYFDYAQRDLMTRYLADFRNGYWLFLGAVHLSATLVIFLPMLRRRRLELATG
jgi:hypothetical membrane protein